MQELAKAICKADYTFHDKYWSDISDAAKGMIRQLLELDVQRRLTAEEALQCPWMTIEEESLTAKDLSGAKDSLNIFKAKQEVAKESAVKPKNKYESLGDVSFTAGLGTKEEVQNRMAKRTNDTLKPVEEENGEVIAEDSTSGKPFEGLYRWGKEIENGGFFVSHECKHRQSKEIFAVKRVERGDLHPSDAVALQDEISALKMVAGGTCIVKLYDVFEEEDYTYMIMERLYGGCVLDYIQENRCYSETIARKLVKGMLRGIEYCHNRRIAIRNLKTEAMMCVTKNNFVDVKIVDFSFAKRVLYPNALETQCGTEGYVSPEVLEHRPAYDVQCDLWSFGVCMFILLGGYRPFRGDSEEVMRSIRYGEFKFHKRYWSDVSEDAKILIARMLTVNPIGRITATAALESDWIKKCDEEKEDSDNVNATELNTGKSKVKAATNAIIATNKMQKLGLNET